MKPNFRISGRADAPPLVLSHGLATDLHMWDDVLPWLEPHFRVIRMDTRGHGGTAPPAEEACTLTDLEGDVLGLLDALGIERAHFAGLSMGGMIGMGLGLNHPERLIGLVVCDARADAPDAYRDSWDQRIAKVKAEGVKALAEPTLDRWFTAGYKSHLHGMDRMRAMIGRTTDAGFIACARALQGLDHKRRLHEMRVPTLYLVGAEDAGAPPEEMAQMHRLTPGASFVTIPAAGHITAVEQPEATGTAIARFLVGLGKGTR